MKKLTVLAFVLLTTTLPAFAQASLFAGLNGAGSTYVSYWGLNPNIKIKYNLISNLNTDFILNGFFDLAPSDDMPGIEAKDYHRSVYADLGLSFKLINRTVSWSIGTGGSYQVGSEQYIGSASYRGKKLIDYQIEKENFSRFGVFIKNTLDFGQAVSLNITVYRFNYWGEYLSFGPSFKIN